jgi:hypothetical protein
LNALTSGEPAPTVQVNEKCPLPTVIDPFPSAVTEKSPAIASAEFEELDDVDDVELDEVDDPDVLEELELETLTDWPDAPLEPTLGSVSGWRRSMLISSPSAQTTLTVEPTT